MNMIYFHMQALCKSSCFVDSDSRSLMSYAKYRILFARMLSLPMSHFVESARKRPPQTGDRLVLVSFVICLFMYCCWLLYVVSYVLLYVFVFLLFVCVRDCVAC